MLFAAARAVGLELEFDNLCLETIFAKVPRAIAGKKLFVNASPRLLGHSVFLDLKVKSRPSWRRDEAMLERLGL